MDSVCVHVSAHEVKVERLYQKMLAAHGSARTMLEEYFEAERAGKADIARYLMGRHADLCTKAKRTTRAWQKERKVKA